MLNRKEFKTTMLDKRRKWEYCEHMMTYTDPRGWRAVLRDMGDGGWELVHVHKEKDCLPVCVFKRESMTGESDG